MKPKFEKLYMTIAEEVAKLSYARRLKVGSIVVKNDRIISFGYNGTAPGLDNNCEIENPDGTLTTKTEVIHSEINSILKLAKNGESAEGAYMFLTHSPCIECSKAIYTAGIKKVYFGEQYRSDDGIKFLQKCGLEVIQTKNDAK